MTTINPSDMLQSVHLQGFKGFRDTQIGPFRQVNLVLGGQNVGKTTLLEAIYVGTNLDLRFLPTVFRLSEGGDANRFYKSIFNSSFEKVVSEFFDGGKLSIASGRTPPNEGVGTRYWGHVGDVKLDIDIFYSSSIFYSAPINKSSIPISMHLPSQMEQVDLYGKVILRKKKKQLIEMLRQIEPQLESLESVSPDGEQRIYVELESVPVALPLQQLGHGFNRLFVLFAQLLVADAKRVLIDEIENGVHYSALPTLFKGVRDIAFDQSIQSIMTTHSWEAIRAAYNVFVEADALDDFQLIRLEREGDNVRAVVINDEQLVTAMESGYEIR